MRPEGCGREIYFTCFVETAGTSRNGVGEFDLFCETIVCHGSSDCARADVWNVKLLIQALLVMVYNEIVKLDNCSIAFQYEKGLIESIYARRVSL